MDIPGLARRLRCWLRGREAPLAEAELARFWAGQNADRAIERFCQAFERGVVIADRPFADLYGGQLHPSTALAVCTHDAGGRIANLPALLALDVRDRPVALMTMAGQAGLRRALAKPVARQGGQLLTYPEDLLAAFVSGNESWRRAGTPIMAPRLSYIIACTARSGSTLLADLLVLNGLGAPREHLRDPLIGFFRYRRRFGADAGGVLRALADRGSAHGIFGTKVVAEFYWQLHDQATARERRTFAAHLLRGPLIYLYRESKVDQAVSDYIANIIGTWHVRSAEGLASHQARVEAVPFDFEAIRGHLATLLEEERRLREQLARRPDVRLVTYRQLMEAPAAVVRDCIAFVTGAPAPQEVTLGTRLLRLTADTNRILREQFIAEARRRGLYRASGGDPLLADFD